MFLSTISRSWYRKVLNFIFNLFVEEARARQASCFSCCFACAWSSHVPVLKTTTKINSTHGILLWLLCLVQDFHILKLVNILVENYLQSQEVTMDLQNFKWKDFNYHFYYLRSTIAKFHLKFCNLGDPSCTL